MNPHQEEFLKKLSELRTPDRSLPSQLEDVSHWALWHEGHRLADVELYKDGDVIVSFSDRSLDALCQVYDVTDEAPEGVMAAIEAFLDRDYQPHPVFPPRVTQEQSPSE